MRVPILDSKHKWQYINFIQQYQDLKPAERDVYLYILNRVDSTLGYAYPSYEEIAKAKNLSERQIRNICKALEEKEFIIRDKGHKGACTRYYFNSPNYLIKKYNINIKEFPMYKYTHLKPNRKIFYVDEEYTEIYDEPQSKPRKTILEQDWSEPIEQPKVEPKITIIEQPKQFQSFEEEEFYKMFE